MTKRNERYEAAVGSLWKRPTNKIENFVDKVLGSLNGAERRLELVTIDGAVGITFVIVKC
ncbi:MAG: hypothetical protein ACTS6G_02800 [Candidatus Hodgkinia cicadicola]